jgi:4-oxalocrotonate tautomerase
MRSPWTDTFFDSARLAVSLISGANEIDLRLYNTVGGQPGTVLETIHASGQMPNFGDFGSGHLVTFDSALHPLLQAGGTYWLLPFASGNTYAAWNINTQGVMGPFACNEVEPTSWDVGQIEGVFTEAQKREIVRKLTDAMVSIEGETMRPVTLVIVEEVKSGDWGIGGKPLTTADVKALAAGKSTG